MHSGSASFAVRSATRMSQAIASSKPPPYAPPLIAQITGTGLLSLAEETRPIRGGFILVDGPVEVNCSFETLVHLQREKLEKQVAQVLFPE